MENIKNKLALVPNKPGCYQMKNKDGVIIYVGKAKNLKNRLASYFRGKHQGKTLKMISEIDTFEYITVDNETESLVLEINLIKKYDPKYNILLRDDKTYPYIELTSEAAPRLSVVRNVSRKRKNINRLFGPYPNVTAARYTANLLNRIYPLRKCNVYPKKPCLYYHINQCLGYCVFDIDKELISNMENEILSFLRGNDDIVISKLENEMYYESSKMNYEKAKELKEMLDYIKVTMSKQKVELNDLTNRDVFGYYVDHGYISITILFIRGGKILERSSKILPLIDLEEEEFNRYIARFYEKNIIMPKEILGPTITDEKLLSSYLDVSVKIPVKGIKKNLVDMANDNAKVSLNEKLELIKKDEKKTLLANESLKELLNLDKLDRIEIFDNSNLFGSYNVSGMVVFTSGRPSKNDYRKFKISISKNDDYGTMREVIYRRYYRVLVDNLIKPDLIIVDGGLGQINVARSVIDSLGLNIPVVGLKKDNKHTTESLLAGNPVKEIKVDRKSDVFYYLERIQDEVHNFTINYHKQLRSKGSLESVFDNIEGIGQKRKEDLLKKYKTITKLMEADKLELETILPKKVVENLIIFLENYKKTN